MNSESEFRMRTSNSEPETPNSELQTLLTLATPMESRSQNPQSKIPKLRIPPIRPYAHTVPSGPQTLLTLTLLRPE